MKRTAYNISCRGEENKEVLKVVFGYTFDIDNYRFGVSNTNPEGVKGAYWRVTELGTGYLCAWEKTKDKAMNAVLNEEFIEKLKTHYPKHKEVNKDTVIQEHYVWMSAE